MSKARQKEKWSIEKSTYRVGWSGENEVSEIPKSETYILTLCEKNYGWIDGWGWNDIRNWGRGTLFTDLLVDFY